MGAHKRGLKPRTFRENRGGESFLENRAFSGQIGAFPGPVGSLFLGADQDQFLRTHSHGEEQELPQKGPFWPNWHLSGQAPVCLAPVWISNERVKNISKLGGHFGPEKYI